MPDMPDTGATADGGFARALIVMAHPDDPEFTAGGTIAAWTSAGTEVAYVIVTDGSKGTSDRTMSVERLVPLREREQRAAGRTLGVDDITFLKLGDGEISPDLELRHAITREIRKHRPDVVVTHDPALLYWDHYINHPDHRAVGQATLDAVFPTARDWLNAPYLLQQEGLEPHHVREVYLAGAKDPDTWIDIAATIETKIDALREHESQIKDMGALPGRIHDRAAGMADGHGMALAEAFKRIRLP
ncbi:MAG: PIG-L deacetylase family protein [Anaerolineae bacterium]|jgi:LmbE family N-acetylglucosaminyl deacetylase